MLSLLDLVPVRFNGRLRIAAVGICAFLTGVFSPERGHAAADPGPVSHFAPMTPVWNRTPFPPGNFRILSNQATSGVLRLRFENLSPYRIMPKSGRVLSLLVAGAPDRVPEISLSRPRFRRVRGEDTLEIRDGIPSSGSPQAVQASVARMSHCGILRHLNVYTLTLNTVLPVTRATSSNDEGWVLESVEVDLDLGPPPSLPAEMRARAEQFREPVTADEPGFVESQVINPNIDPAFYHVTQVPVPEAVRQWEALLENLVKEGPVYRIRIYEPGLYSLSPDVLLRAAGGDKLGSASPPAPGPLSEWRLFRRGSEVPLLISDSGSPSGGRALFHVAAADVAQGEGIYWLLPRALPRALAEAPETSAPRRMEVLTSPAPSPGKGETTDTLARYEVTASRAEDYNPRLRAAGEVGRWYWRSVGEKEFTDLSLTLPEGFDPERAWNLELRISYGCPSPFSVGPTFRLLVNGVEDLSTSLTAVHGVCRLQVPPGLLRPGLNRLAARIIYPEDRRDRPDMLIQKLTVEWSQPLGDPKLATLPFQTDDPSTGPVTLAWGRGSDTVTSPGALLFVGKAGAVYALKPAETVKGSGAGQLRFLDPRPGKGVYQLADPKAVGAPPVVEAVGQVLEPGRLGPADYLIVAPPEFHEALQPLIERRQKDGLKVAVADPQAVFDRYSFGARDAEAIRLLLAQAFYHWPAPKLRFVLLAGEASDYRGNPEALPEGGQPDLVPVFYAGRSDRPHGDHPYATLAGEDPLVDLEVGRLPVRTAGELSRLVDKILAYEDAPVEGQEWLERTEYIYDDDAEFPNAVAGVMARGQAPPGRAEHLRQTDHVYVPNARVPGRKRSYTATSELLRRFQEGMAVVNFFGHGGPNLWSHERMLHLSDVPSLKNAPHLPFITCASCDNAWLDYPIRPVNVSIGELLVKLPQGGAIGLFGPVAGASPFEHQTLVGRLMEGLYRQQIRRMGHLTAYAKNMYFADTRSGNVQEQYILLGDPALRLRVPLLAPGMELRPVTLTAGKAWSAQVRLSGAGADVTAGVYAIQDLATGEQIVSGPVRFSAMTGGRSARLIGPALSPGAYSVSVRAGGKVHAQRVLVTPAGGASVEPRDSLAPIAGPEGISIVPLDPFNGHLSPSSAESPQFVFLFRNEGTTATTDLVARILAGGGDDEEVLARNDELGDVAPGDERLISLASRWSFAEGPATVTLQLMRHSTSETLLLRPLGFNVVAPPRLEFVPGTARIEGGSGGAVTAHETVTLRAELKNSGAKTARGVHLRARLDDPSTGTEARTINNMSVSQVGDIAPGETVPVTFRWEDADQNAEQRKLFLVATQQSAGAEPSASIEMPRVRIWPAPNLTVSRFKVSPANPRSGTTVTLTAVATAERIVSKGHYDVELGLLDVISGESSVARLRIDDLSRPSLVTAELPLDRPYSIAYVEINPAREFYEGNMQDNRLELRLEPVVEAAAPGRSSGREIRLPFDGGLTTNILVVPGTGLYLTEAFDSAPVTKIEPSHAVTGRFIPSRGGGDRPVDGQWSVISGLAETFESEDAGPLGLRLAAEVDSTSRPLYNVTFQATPVAERGRAADGLFEVRVEEEPDFRPVSYRVESVKPVADVDLGRYDLRDSAFDAEIRATSTTIFLSGIQLQPVAGFFRSPVYDLGSESAGRRGSLRIEASNVTPENVVSSWRTGTREAPDGEIAWADWQEGEGLTIPVSLEGPLFQWRFMLTPGGTGRPELITGARLTIE